MKHVGPFGRLSTDVCIFLNGNVYECRIVLVKNLIKENFYRKKKKKVINVLIVFFISHQSDVKTFLK